jgi:hypothetical protein
MIRAHEGQGRAVALKEDEPVGFEGDVETEMGDPEIAAVAQGRGDDDRIAIDELHGGALLKRSGFKLKIQTVCMSNRKRR